MPFHRIRNQEALLNAIRKLNFRRNVLVVLLFLALVATLIYGTLEDPFQYTFSKIGNYFHYREWYILWAVYVGLAIQTAALCLFRLEQYPARYAYISIYCATFFLIVTALIPSLKEEMFIWHVIHKWTTFFYVMSTLTALHPFVLYLGRTKPRLWILLRNWELLILIGSMSSLIIQGQTGIFELWFIVMALSLLGYLVIVLHRHKIEKLYHTRHESGSIT
ncbi:MAG: hypothetical protein PHX07_07175 [Candidatus Marinimicrobia bacterium]|nr:hypothetical protein [Candidatus Neomarinimicrobiota bacterium]